MFPSFSCYNKIDGVYFNAIFFGKHSPCINIWNMFFSYFQNLFFSKFVVTRIFSNGGSISIFKPHISYVFNLRASPKMFWIHTNSIIAFMKYAMFSFWFSTHQFIAHPMGSIKFPFEPDSTVSIGKLGSFPNPTRFSFFNFIKKNFFYAVHNFTNSLSYAKLNITQHKGG